MPNRLTKINELNEYPCGQTPWIFWIWLKEPDRTITHAATYDSWHAKSYMLGNHTAASAGELAAKLLTAMGYAQP